MSDDLVKRLRADMTRDEFFVVAESVLTLAVDRIEELEAKLAKAVEFAEHVEKYGPIDLWDTARATLRELRGETDE